MLPRVLRRTTAAPAVTAPRSNALWHIQPRPSGAVACCVDASQQHPLSLPRGPSPPNHQSCHPDCRLPAARAADSAAEGLSLFPKARALERSQKNQRKCFASASRPRRSFGREEFPRRMPPFSCLGRGLEGSVGTISKIAARDPASICPATARPTAWQLRGGGNGAVPSAPTAAPRNRTAPPRAARGPAACGSGPHLRAAGGGGCSVCHRRAASGGVPKPGQGLRDLAPQRPPNDLFSGVIWGSRTRMASAIDPSLVVPSAFSPPSFL